MSDFWKKAAKVVTPGASYVADKFFSGRPQGTTQPGNADRDAGYAEYMEAIKEFENNGSEEYQWLGDMQNINQSGTEYDKIQLDPQYAHFERQALRDLEQQSQDGLSMRDQADLAQLEGQVNRQNAGRQGAIQQSMAARGMAGSGMELVSQMQASQDATERQALASMEKAAMTQQGRRDATSRLGSQATQMSARDYQQQAQRAAAQDRINNFNTANQVDTSRYNHGGRQATANSNTTRTNDFSREVMSAKQGGAGVRYNRGTEANNTATSQDVAQNTNKRMIADALIKGGSAAAGKMYNGGVVPGEAKVPGDHPANDTVPTMLSPGEIVIPRSVAQKDHNSDAIDSLLKAMSSMQKKGKQ